MAVIGFEAPGFSGRLFIHAGDAVLAKMCGERAAAHSARDWCRELANQLLGRIKSRLVRFQVALRIGIPSSASAEVIERYRAPGTQILDYFFHAVRGEVFVSLIGTFDGNALVFNSVDPKIVEGDVMLF
jgi:hypothetical protein